MSYQGDLAPGATLWFAFTSRRFTTGVPFALAAGALAVYQDASDTQSTAGVTLTASFDGVTGQNRVTIDTSADGTFYAVGHDYSVILSAGTVDSVSVVGEVLATFSMGHRSSLRPTTAGRTLDVSVSGEAGVDWANVGSPTTTLALTGTTISSSQVAASVTGAVASVTGAVGSVAGNVGGNVVGSVASVTAAVTVEAASVRAAVGLASANLDTQLAALAAFVDTEVGAILATVDTEVGAIKAKTDQLTFTNALKLDASLQAAADLATVVGQKVADMVLRRSAANIEASSFGDALSADALYGLLCRASHADTTTHAGHLTIFKTDGVTELAQVVLATDAFAEPITGFGA